jgi:hypothetical protein
MDGVRAFEVGVVKPLFETRATGQGYQYAVASRYGELKRFVPTN